MTPEEIREQIGAGMRLVVEPVGRGSCFLTEGRAIWAWSPRERISISRDEAIAVLADSAQYPSWELVQMTETEFVESCGYPLGDRAAYRLRM